MIWVATDGAAETRLENKVRVHGSRFGLLGVFGVDNGEHLEIV